MKRSKLKPNFYQQGGFSPLQLSNSQFIPTYAGVPLAEAERYGEGLSKIYHQNIADLTKLDIMNANRKVMKGDEARSQQYNQYLKGQMEDLAKKGDYENMTLKANALAREFVNDKALKAMAESREKADADIEMRNKLLLAGQTPWFAKNVDEHQTVSLDENGNEVYNIYKPTTEAKLKHQEKRSEIWGPLKANAGPMSLASVKASIPAIDGYISTGQWRGISGGVDKNGNPTGKIAQLLNHAMTEYKSTAEYDQEKRKDIQDLMSQNEDMSLEAATAEAEKLARKRMFSEGMLRTFSEVDPQYLQNWMLKEQMDAAGKTGGSEHEALPEVRVPALLGFNIDDFDPNRVMDSPDVVSVSPNLASSGYLNYASKVDEVASKAKKQAEQSAFNTAAMAGAMIFGDPKKASEQGTAYYTSPEAFANAKKYTDLMTRRTYFPSEQSYSQNADPTFGERQTESLRNHITSRVAYDLATNEKVLTGAGGKVSDEFMELIGGDLKNMKAVGSLNPKNPYYRLTGSTQFADGEHVQVFDEKKGTVRELIVSKPKSFYESPVAQRNAITNLVWDKLALSPGQHQNFKVGEVPVTAMTIPNVDDPSGGSDTVRIWKLGGHEFPDGYDVPGGYDGLINLIEALNKQ